MIAVFHSPGCRVVVLLASAVYPLVDEQLVQASWWEGLAPAHWWVELGLVPLLGSAMSGAVFIRQLFRKTFSILFADAWGCVLTLFCLWHPRTGAYRLLGGTRSW